MEIVVATPCVLGSQGCKLPEKLDRRRISLVSIGLQTSRCDLYTTSTSSENRGFLMAALP